MTIQRAPVQRGITQPSARSGLSSDGGASGENASAAEGEASAQAVAHEAKGLTSAERSAVRSAALRGSDGVQAQLHQQVTDHASAMASIRASANEIESELAGMMLEGVQGLGFEVDDLQSPEGQAAINQIKGYAGLVMDGEMDLDLLLAILMIQAEQDRYQGTQEAIRHPGPTTYGKDPNNRGMSMDRTAPVDAANWKPGQGDVTPEQLVAIASKSGHKLSMSKAREVAPHLNRAMAEANIDTPKKKAAFLAQLMHESGSFRYSEEIASGAAYEGRRDLGNTQRGDGKRYKGRGFIQLTGRANYAAAGKALGLDLVNNPELASRPENAARVAAWYWNSRGLSSLAERGNFNRITKKINGGYNGKADRDRLYGNALDVLKDSHGRPSTGTFIQGSASTASAQSVSATDGMTDEQKYDYYKDLIERNGGTVNGEPGQRNIIGLRQENHRTNAYDDRMAVIWRDAQGRPHVREFDANMESISRYQGRFGRDVNRDGRRDLASLASGTHSFARGTSSRYGQILRPTSTTEVMRDTDGDGKGDTLDRTGAGRSILFHRGGRNDTGSAGCQTMDPRTFDAFMQTLGSQRNFQYTLVDVG